MKLTVLGNNGPFPAAGGACSGYFVQHEDTRIQLDLGAGTLAALTKLTDPAALTALVFSHWHFDHCSDVLPLLYRLGGDTVLDVYVILYQGARIQETSVALQQNVKMAVQSMTGKPVTKVNVHIEGIVPVEKTED